MGQPARVQHSSRARTEQPAGESLFKPDHPRAIDRYIDYFGGSPAEQDACGEALLEHLA